jgi:transcriptional regulator with XRE-family HTH domain
MAITGESTVEPMRRTKRVDPAILEHFGKELDRWVQEAHDDNQSAAGRALGLSQGHISAMIQGHRGPGLPTLILLAEQTGRSIDSLLGLERAKSRDDRILAELAEMRKEFKGQSPPEPVASRARRR